MTESVLILDNGASRIKYGWSQDLSPQSINNCTANVKKQMLSYVGDQVDSAPNASLLSYSRPFDHGYLTKMGIELDIWTHLFSKNCLSIHPSDHNLVLTETPFNFESLQNDMNEVVFEEFGFKNYLRRVGAWFSAYEYSKNPLENACVPNCCTVIDSGFSFTHVLPFINLKCNLQSCKRVNVGGKMLTNHLKEVVSYRQWNMMDEFKLINQVKEELCYISLDITHELKLAKQNKVALDFMDLPLKRFFVLPDFHTIHRGYVKPHDELPSQNEQLLVMESERFSIPEVLFQPQLVGLNQAGIGEALAQAYERLQNQVEVGLVAANILLTGGNANLPQFDRRLFNEVRPCVPDIFPVNIYVPPSPEEYAWRGARRFVNDQQQLSGSNWIDQEMVSRREYFEYGHCYCNDKFKKST